MATAAESGSRLSGHTLDKATKAKVHLENYYSNLVSQHLERKGRHDRLEETMREEGLSEEQVRSVYTYRPRYLHTSLAPVDVALSAL